MAGPKLALEQLAQGLSRRAVAAVLEESSGVPARQQGRLGLPPTR